MCPSSGDISPSNFKLSTCFRVINTKCRIDTVISPDDGHIVARNMYRKEINILRKTVHQFGFIYKIIQGRRSTKHKKPTATVNTFTSKHHSNSTNTNSYSQHTNKTTNEMQQSIVKFIALSYRYCSTCFGHYNAHHQEPVKLPLQPLVSV